MSKRRNRLAGMMLAVMLLTLVAPGPAAFAAAPGIVISTPADYSVTATASATVSGYVTDTTILRINNSDVSFNSNGFFSTTVTGLAAGNNQILITAMGPSGTTNKYLYITYDTNAAMPAISISSPSDNSTVNSSSVTITGRVYNNTGFSISVNGTVAYSGADNGNFSRTVTVSPGDNNIVLTADKSGISVTRELHIKYEAQSVITDVTVNAQPVNDYIAVTATPAALAGSAAGATAVTVSNNGTTVPSAFVAGAFSATLNLSAGANNISIVATGSGINETRNILIYYGAAGPQVYNVSPADGTTVYGTTVTVTGTFRDAKSVTVNGTGVFSSSSDSSGSFSRAVTLTGEQWNTVTVMASGSGGTITQTYSIYSETDPVIVIEKPTPGQIVYSNAFTMYGKVYNTVSGGLTVNGTAVTFDSSGGFNRTLTLKPGSNTITVTARNAAGVTATSNVTVEYRGGPAIYNLNPVSGTVVSTGTVTISGTVSNTSSGGLKINGAAVSFGSNGNFNKSVSLNHGVNTFTITATDGISTATSTLQITFDASPVIIVTSPSNNSYSVNKSASISGKVFNTDSGRFLVNGSAVNFNSTDGSFYATVTLEDFVNDIKLEAYKGSLLTTTTLRVYYSGVPDVEITSHKTGDTVDTADVIISGTVFPPDPSEINTFTVKGVDCKSRVVNGTFRSQPVTLASGDNEIEVVLTTKALGGGALASRTVSRKIKLIHNAGPSITVSSPLDGSTVYSNSVTVYGRLTRADLNTLKIGSQAVTPGSDGSFSQAVTLKAGKNNITLSASLSDAKTSKTISVYYNPIGQDGAVVKTKMTDGGEAKGFEDMIKVKLEKGSVGINTTAVLTARDNSDMDAPPVQSSFVGPVVNLYWDGDKPLKPYRVTLKYDAVVRENQSHKITILNYDDEHDEWDILGGTVDPKSRTVYVQTDRAGHFAAVIYFKTFDDVINHWAQRDIEFLVARGAVSGESENRFNPNDRITRAEFTTFIVKALGIEPYEPTRESYSDVTEGHWAWGYIEAALRAGFVSGINSNEFAPNRYITRQEAAVILAKAGNLKTVKDQEMTKLFSAFSDADRIGRWAKKDLAATIKAKIMNGLDNGYFSPDNNTTRAQAAAMIARLVEVTGKNKK